MSLVDDLKIIDCHIDRISSAISLLRIRLFCVVSCVGRFRLKATWSPPVFLLTVRTNVSYVSSCVPSFLTVITVGSASQGVCMPIRQFCTCRSLAMATTTIEQRAMRVISTVSLRPLSQVARSFLFIGKAIQSLQLQSLVLRHLYCAWLRRWIPVLRRHYLNIHMFESNSSIEKPNKSFNLLHLENNEVYFMSLKAGLLIDSAAEEIKGKLHLCSRSIFFEPKSLDHPLLRMKFSSNIFLRLMKNIDSQKLKGLVGLSESDVKGTLAKGVAYMTELLEKEPTERQDGKPKNVLLQRLFNPKKTSNPLQEKINNALFVKVQKVFLIYRWPMSPYITEKTDDNFVFVLAKSNLKQQILRFLKIYDGLLQVDNETVPMGLNEKFIRALIDATLSEGLGEFQQLHKHNELKHVYKCKRVTCEGVVHGVFGIVKNKLLFYPIVNCPDQTTVQFCLRDVKHVSRYRYMFVHNGLELWMYNKRTSLLLVFDDKTIRENIYKHLKQHCEKLIRVEMATVINRWINGEISNFEYLMYLNSAANRSFNDLSQYPIFPWVLSDYSCSELDLNNYEMYRDLSKPVGAINKSRLQLLKDNYVLELKDKTLTHPPCIYPTHYSTPGYVVYYLIRKVPEFIIKLQNGVFSPSQRIFRSIQQTYYNSLKLSADFKQLTPEFYETDFDFLVNNEKLELGMTPEGEINDDVVLPKWANSPQDFLLKMRTALESDYVSSHINQWIDLIFGFKQTGSNAIVADNLFYHMTYEENVKMDRVMSPQERLAVEVQISEFGQTPPTLFSQMHPTKKTRILRISENRPGEDKAVLASKVKMLSEENDRLRDQAEHERYRFNRKLTEKEELIIKSQREKRRQIQQMKQQLGIDNASLGAFVQKEKFKTDKEKEQYLRQLQQLLKQAQRENEKYRVLVDGLTRQLDREEESITSSVEGQLEQRGDIDFLNDSV